MMQDFLTSEPVEQETLTPKLRGGYYTPAPIAHFLAEWAIKSKRDRVLEPSCGDGSLVEAAAQRLLEIDATPWQISDQLRATELFYSEAAIARGRLEQLNLDGSSIVSVGDFFTSLGNDSELLFEETPLRGLRFEAVLGNPPFLRFQTFPEQQRRRAFFEMHQAGLHPNRLTNAWVPFLIASAQRLTETGRLAMVIPAELLQVGYAGETRAYLSRYFASITIITFRKLVFPGIQQEVVLLLAERGPNSAHTIDIVELNDIDDLSCLASQLKVNNSHKPLIQARDKWTLYFLDPLEIELMHELSNRADIPRLGSFARVEVGVVTGNNSFFVQSEKDVQKRDLQSFVKPLVGRTAQLPGLLYTPIDHENQRHAGAGCWLLDLPPAVLPSDSVMSYIKEGEQNNVHTGYKCRIRPKWYTVPSSWTPNAFLFRQIYRYPKLVTNLTSATSTDTVHRMRLLRPVNVAQVSGAFYNILTFAFAEIIGRSYGGGVLEIEPGEAGHLPVPFFDDVALDIAALDELERGGKTNEILTVTTRLIQDRLGLDFSDCQRLKVIWKKLSERRVGRKNSSNKLNEK